jgi:MoaA/NifB/PqqE/SkfB family radical SAM enzyme
MNFCGVLIKIPFMRRIYIEITRKCGFKCDFCPSDAGDLAALDARETPLALFQIAASEAAKLTREVSLHVLGDPLLARNLAEYLNICAENKLKASIASVAFPLTDRAKTALLHPAIKQINFSASGFAANQERLKISTENYLKPLAEFALIAVAKGDRFVNFRLWDDTRLKFNQEVAEILGDFYKIVAEKTGNYLQLAPRIRIAYDRRFDWAKPNEIADREIAAFTTMTESDLTAITKRFAYSKSPSARGRACDDERVIAREFAITKDQANASDYGIADQVRNDGLAYELAIVKERAIAPKQPPKAFCHGAKEQCAILSNGVVTPCCIDYSGAIALGNIAEKSLVEILKSPRAKALIAGFKRGVAVEPLCQICGFRARFNQIAKIRE